MGWWVPAPASVPHSNTSVTLIDSVSMSSGALAVELFTDTVTSSLGLN